MTAVKASPMKWEGREAYLVTCHDITRYKEPAALG